MDDDEGGGGTPPPRDINNDSHNGTGNIKDDKGMYGCLDNNAVDPSQLPADQHNTHNEMICDNINGMSSHISSDKLFPILHYDNCDDYTDFKVVVQVSENAVFISTLRIAKILKNLGYCNKITEIKRIGRASVLILCEDKHIANALVDDRRIREAGLKAYIPLYYLTRSAVIKGVDSDISNEELFEDIDSGFFHIKKNTSFESTHFRGRRSKVCTIENGTDFFHRSKHTKIHLYQ